MLYNIFYREREIFFIIKYLEIELLYRDFIKLMLFFLIIYQNFSSLKQKKLNNNNVYTHILI